MRVIAAFKCRLVEIAKLDSVSLPAHRKLISYLEEQSARDPDIHPATNAFLNEDLRLAIKARISPASMGKRPAEERRVRSLVVPGIGWDDETDHD